MSLYPRLSPNGLRLVTQDVRRYRPCWMDDIDYASFVGNGWGITTSAGKVYPWPEPDLLTAGGGIFGACYWGQDGVQGIRLSSGFTVAGGYHGALSEDGRLVYLTGHDSQNQTLRDFGGTTYDSGAPLEYPRACVGGLTWSRYTGRDAHQRETWFAPWAGPKQRVHASGDLIEFRPVVIDTPGGVWIAVTTNDDVRLYPVGSTEGYRLPSDNPVNLDAKWNGSGIRMTWNVGGLLLDRVIDLTKPRVRLDVAVVPPPPPPTPPPASTETPKVTISSYLPASGPAPLRVRAVAVLSGGKAKQLWWRWKRQGGAWNLAVKNPATDLDHTFTNFTTPGVYYIGVDVTDLTGTITNGTQQERKVTVTG